MLDSPTPPALPPHHAPLSLKIILLVFAVVLIAVLGYLVWWQNSQTDTNESTVIKKSKTTTTTAACQTSNLTATLSDGSGTAGTYYYTLTLTNKGSSTCSLTGSPKISALDAAGATVGTTTPPSHDAKTITVASGGKAYATIGFPDSGNFDAASCKAMKSLVIYPPNQTDGITIANIDTYNSAFTAKYCQALNVADFSDQK